jgi:hypothetical protein
MRYLTRAQNELTRITMSNDECGECSEDKNPLMDKAHDEAFAPVVKKPHTEEDGVSVYSVNKMLKQRMYAQTHECMMASGVIVFICGGCILSYLYCQQCLLGILVFSACMCPWIPYFNVPLWVSIIMLVSLGWHFTVGRLTLTWQ